MHVDLGLHGNMAVYLLLQQEDPDEDDAFALMASLKRIYAFFR